MRVVCGLFFLVALFLFTGPTFALTDFDHGYSDWKKVLDRYAKDGLVDYGALKNAAGDLDRYLEKVKTVSFEEYHRWDNEQKIAFWINTYNALVMNAVVDNYPLKKGMHLKAFVYPENSVQQIPDIWRRKVIRIFGRETSLDDIEHGILRKEFSEPRIHFALVCASSGCPRLRGEPYFPEKLSRQLDEEAVKFLSDPAKAQYDSGKDLLHLSPIFQWFRGDFEKAGGLFPFLRRYLPKETAAKVSSKTSIRWLGYDWSLNERKSVHANV